MKIWLVSREYAGIAEAGGVKNVACSLCETLVKEGHDVTLFIPYYACTDLTAITDYEENIGETRHFFLEYGDVDINYSRGNTKNGVRVVFIKNKEFMNRRGVYTWTKEDEEENPAHKKGSGHDDFLRLNTLFQKATLIYYLNLKNEDAPDIIHCQDAATAMIPSLLEYMKTFDKPASVFYSHTRCIVTIHNSGPGYLQNFPSLGCASFITGLPSENLRKGLIENEVSPFLLASYSATLTTVSPEYGEEIILGKVETCGLSQKLKDNHIKIYGITNGIDFERYNPSDSKESCLPFEYNPSKMDFEGKYKNRDFFLNTYALKRSPSIKGIEKHGFLERGDGTETYIVYHGRIVTQKGINVLTDAASTLLNKDVNVRFIFMGQGEPRLEEKLKMIAGTYPGRAVYFQGYDKALSRLCTASADFSIFPSIYEPCGLEDFIAQIYGTLPVANATGGLNKIIDDETGFLYSPDTSSELCSLLFPLIKLHNASPSIYNPMRKYAFDYVKKVYSWKNVVEEHYLPLYDLVIAKS